MDALGRGVTDRNRRAGDLVRLIRARLAAWERTRVAGRRYYSAEDLRFLPPLAASDPIVTGTRRGRRASAGDAKTIERPSRPSGRGKKELVEADTLELFERKLRELERAGWLVIGPIDLANDGQTVRCWMQRGRRPR